MCIRDRVSQSVKEQWGKLIERYLHKSKQLKAVFLLIDIRHKPSENDKTMYDWIVYNGYQPIIIAVSYTHLMILGELGLLKGKKATCYPGFEDKLAGAEVCTVRVVRDGNITTSRGLGLSLIHIYSQKKSTDIGNRLSHLYSQNSQKRRQHKDGRDKENSLSGSR